MLFFFCLLNPLYVPWLPSTFFSTLSSIFWFCFYFPKKKITFNFLHKLSYIFHLFINWLSKFIYVFYWLDWMKFENLYLGWKKEICLIILFSSSSCSKCVFYSWGSCRRKRKYPIIIIDLCFFLCCPNALCLRACEIILPSFYDIPYCGWK